MTDAVNVLRHSTIRLLVYVKAGWWLDQQESFRASRAWATTHDAERLGPEAAAAGDV